MTSPTEELKIVSLILTPSIAVIVKVLLVGRMFVDPPESATSNEPRNQAAQWLREQHRLMKQSLPSPEKLGKFDSANKFFNGKVVCD